LRDSKHFAWFTQNAMQNSVARKSPLIQSNKRAAYWPPRLLVYVIVDGFLANAVFLGKRFNRTAAVPVVGCDQHEFSRIQAKITFIGVCFSETRSASARGSCALRRFAQLESVARADRGGYGRQHEFSHGRSIIAWVTR
jgi:hypothetical protein